MLRNHVVSFFIRKVSQKDSSRTRFSFYFSVFQYLALECLFWLLLRTCTWVLKLIQQLDTFGMIYSRYNWSATKQRPWPWNVHNWCVKNRNNDNRCSYHQRATSIWFICFIYLYICFTLNCNHACLPQHSWKLSLHFTTIKARLAITKKMLKSAAWGTF